jgi:A/G-specific adenine glycosylase
VPGSTLLTNHRTGFQTALLAWYRRNQRTLPWRTAPSLYKTVVSEFMLQQTQVATVLPYFDRWLRALPDFPALAAAPESQVLKLWEGLGYYSRARNLNKLAQAIASRPEPPCSPAEWRELPGVGPYTAAAIASIASGHPVAVVDGNVVRVLARLINDRARFRDGSAAAKHFAPLADSLLNPANPGDHNQAMMELGATVCTRQSPKCGECPVAHLCAAYRAGTASILPRFVPKKSEPMFVLRTFCLDRGRILLHRAPPNSRRLAGLHELPQFLHLGLAAPSAKPLAIKRRTITRDRISESIHAMPPDVSIRVKVAADSSLVWVPLKSLSRIPLSGPHKRWIAELLRAKRQST